MQYAKFFNKEECPAFYRELKKKTPEFTASIKRMQSKSLAAIVKKFGAQSIQNPKKLWLTMLTLESMVNITLSLYIRSHSYTPGDGS